MSQPAPSTPLSISSATDLRSPSSSRTYGSTNTTPEQTHRVLFPEEKESFKSVETKELLTVTSKSIEEIKSVMIEFSDHFALVKEKLEKAKLSPEAVTDINIHIHKYYRCQLAYASFLRHVDAAMTEFKIVLSNIKTTNNMNIDLSKQFMAVQNLKEEARKLQQELLELLPDIMTLKQKYGFEFSVQVKNMTGFSTFQMAMAAIGLGLATGVVGSMTLPLSIAGWLSVGTGGLTGAAAAALGYSSTHSKLSEEDMVAEMQRTVDAMQSSLGEFQDRFVKIGAYEGAHQTTPLQSDQIDELIAITETIIKLVVSGQNILRTTWTNLTVRGQHL